MLLLRERPDGDALAQQPLGQLRGPHRGMIEPHEQEIGDTWIDVEPRQLGQFLAQPLSLAVDQDNAPPRVLLVGQQGGRSLLRRTFTDQGSIWLLICRATAAAATAKPNRKPGMA